MVGSAPKKLIGIALGGNMTLKNGAVRIHKRCNWDIPERKAYGKANRRNQMNLEESIVELVV